MNHATGMTSMKSRFLTLLLGMAMSACIGQEVLSSLPQTIVPGQQRREVQPCRQHCGMGIGPLDSIKVWDNQTGQLISRKAFKYDQTGRIIRNETFTAEHSIPYTLEELLYPGNDALVIMTRSFRNIGRMTGGLQLLRSIPKLIRRIYSTWRWIGSQAFRLDAI